MRAFPSWHFRPSLSLRLACADQGWLRHHRTARGRRIKKTLAVMAGVFVYRCALCLFGIAVLVEPHFVRLDAAHYVFILVAPFAVAL